MNQRQPKISIIVPIYNVERYLDKCIQSLIGQTLKDIEIILVNDGSLDQSPMICDKYAKQDYRIKVIHKHNEGLSSARNAGLEIISGEYFMFVDSDDWLDVETCEVSYNCAIHRQVDCLMFTYTKEFGDHSIVNHTFDQEYFELEKEQIKTYFHRRLFGLLGDELAKPQDADLIVTACMQLFRTEKFRHIQFVDTRIIGTEDCWYQVLVYENCDRFVYIDKPYYHYRRNNEYSLTTKFNPNLFARWQNMFDYMEKYIVEHNKGNDYKQALQNRIAISLLGAGINQTHSDDNLIVGGKHIKEILEVKRYKNALAQLDISVMPMSWKVFFFLAKHKMPSLLFVMLKMIEFLRTHKK